MLDHRNSLLGCRPCMTHATAFHAALAWNTSFGVAGFWSRARHVQAPLACWQHQQSKQAHGSLIASNQSQVQRLTGWQAHPGGPSNRRADGGGREEVAAAWVPGGGALPSRMRLMMPVKYAAGDLMRDMSEAANSSSACGEGVSLAHVNCRVGAHIQQPAASQECMPKLVHNLCSAGSHHTHVDHAAKCASTTERTRVFIHGQLHTLRAMPTGMDSICSTLDLRMSRCPRMPRAMSRAISSLMSGCSRLAAM